MLTEVLVDGDPFSIEVFAELFGPLRRRPGGLRRRPDRAAPPRSQGAGARRATDGSSRARPADPRRAGGRRHRPPRPDRRRRRHRRRHLAIGRLAGESAHRVIDADGLVVAPGIVDAHTHYDPQLTWDPLCDTSALHGVTTVAAGNCGFSIAPCRTDDHDVRGADVRPGRGHGPRRPRPDPVERSRPSASSSRHPHGQLGVNLGMYVGHSAVRRWVMGDAAFERAVHRRRARRDRRAASTTRCTPARSGFSSSHAPTHLDMADRPVPSRLSSLDELRALAEVDGPHRARLDRLRPGERGRGHRRRRPRPAHRAGRPGRRAAS